MLITLADIQALKSCWDTDRLKARVPTQGVTYIQIAEASDVSVKDRRWLLTQLAARTREGRRVLAGWVAGCAQDVVHNTHDADRDVCAAAIAAALAWVKDPCKSTRDAAYAAAHAASACRETAYAAYYASGAAYYASGAAYDAYYASGAAYYAAYYVTAAADADAASRYAAAAVAAAAAADAAGDAADDAADDAAYAAFAADAGATYAADAAYAASDDAADAADAARARVVEKLIDLATALTNAAL